MSVQAALHKRAGYYTATQHTTQPTMVGAHTHCQHNPQHPKVCSNETHSPPACRLIWRLLPASQTVPLLHLRTACTSQHITSRHSTSHHDTAWQIAFKQLQCARLLTAVSCASGRDTAFKGTQRKPANSLRIPASKFTDQQAESHLID